MQINPLAFTAEKLMPEKTAGSAAAPGNLFQQVLQEANQRQLEADWQTNMFISGKTDDLHQVIIAAEQARLSLQLTTQVTNRIIEAYREINRMQI